MMLLRRILLQSYNCAADAAFIADVCCYTVGAEALFADAACAVAELACNKRS